MSPPPHLSHPWRTSPGAPLGARPSVGRGRIARHPATASISYAVPRASALAEAEARQPAIIQHQLLGCLARNNIGSALKEKARRMNPALLVRIFEGDWRHHFPYGGWRHQFPYGGRRHHCPYIRRLDVEDDEKLRAILIRGAVAHSEADHPQKLESARMVIVLESAWMVIALGCWSSRTRVRSIACFSSRGWVYGRADRRCRRRKCRRIQSVSPPRLWH